LQIYLAESKITVEEMADRINDQLKTDNHCLVVVSEGFNVGDIGEVKDSFGHTSFGSSQISVYQNIINRLNEKGLKARGSARGQVMGTDQRATAIYASTIDIDEAYRVGQKAVELAINEGNGWMATILRNPGEQYSVRYDKVPLDKVALSERTFPEKWITSGRTDVTNEFIRYVRPLTGDKWPEVPMENGLQRFTKFKPIFADKQLKEYLPEAYG